MDDNEARWVEDDDGSYYYYYSDGTMATGWMSDGSDWYYFYGDGEMATGWIKYNGDWYYLYPGGSMARNGPIPDSTDNNGFDLDNSTGKMVNGTGWLKDGITGEWYYFSDGEMKSNDTEDGYHLDSSGKMVTGTGWEHVDSWWYYLDDTGKVVTGWLYDQGNWYYLYPQGSMAKDTTVNGYYLNDDGIWKSNEDDGSSSQGTSDADDNTKKSQVLLALTNAYNGAISEDDRKVIITLEDNVKNDSIDISNVKTTEIDGATYLDYSDTANTMLMNHAHEASYHPKDVFWFNSMEKGGGPWDIKLQKNWGNAMPNTLYLGRSGTFAIYGQTMSADDLGNLHYGYVGRAANYDIDFLSLAAGAANIRDNSKVSLPVALVRASQDRAPAYGDKKGDNDWVREGYTWAINSGWNGTFQHP